MWISKKKFDTIVSEAKALLASLKRLENKAYLISIERAERKLVFTFSRNGELHQVETMSLMSDNLPEWKEKLLR